MAKKRKKELKLIDISKIKKEKFYEVFYFEAYYKRKKKDKKIRNRMFRVNATNFQRARARVNRFFEKNKKFKEYHLHDIYHITDKKVINDSKVKEINPQGKPKIVKKERVDTGRLQVIEHKKFGDVFIADPNIAANKDIVGTKVLFWVPTDEEKLELKTLLFDKKFFKLDLKLKMKLFRGTQQSRQREIRHVIEKLERIERLSRRAIEFDLSSVNKEAEKLFKGCSKQYMKIAEENAEEIVRKVLKLRKKNVGVNTDTGRKQKYTLLTCIRKVWRKNVEYDYADLEIALSMLKKEGYKVPKVIAEAL